MKDKNIIELNNNINLLDKIKIKIESEKFELEEDLKFTNHILKEKDINILDLNDKIYILQRELEIKNEQLIYYEQNFEDLKNDNIKLKTDN